MQTIKSQFGHPRGLLGQLVGAVMAFENRKRIIWAVEQLCVQSSDHVIEIGYGPGVGISLLAEKAAMVGGVDISNVMLWQASRRNAQAIRDGRVILRQGSAQAIPFGDAKFNRVLAINSLHIWPEAIVGLRECYRVLRPGGCIGIAEQPPEKITDMDIIRQRGTAIIELLYQAGFQNGTQRLQAFPNGWATFVEGLKDT